VRGSGTACLPHDGALTGAREMAGESMARLTGAWTAASGGTATWTSASAARFGPGDGGFGQRRSGHDTVGTAAREARQAGERLSGGGRRSGRGATGEASERDSGGRDSGGQERI
jgi:hypothetical protein